MIKKYNKNAFGSVLPEIKKIVQNKIITKYIEKTLKIVLDELKINAKNALHIIKCILKEAKSYTKIEDYEKAVYELLEKNRVLEIIPQKLLNRADIMYSQIKKFLAGNVLDLGCGDGRVGVLIAEKNRLKVVLADIYRHKQIKKTNLKFHKLKSNGKINITPKTEDKKFDTTLLLTVLHHSSFPLRTLKEAKRLTKKGGKIIIIESVYGISDKTIFGKLTSEEQRLSNIFFDHLYNRIFHFSAESLKKVNVPFNFQTPKAWKRLFEKFGMKQKHFKLLGIDQPIVPEYHTLHILVK